MSLLSLAVRATLLRTGFVLMRSEERQSMTEALAKFSHKCEVLGLENAQLAAKVAEFVEREERVNGAYEQMKRLESEKRELMIRLTGAAHVDYQVVMDYHEKEAAFRDADPAFHALYERVKPFTMTSIERLYAMYKATEYIVRTGLPGDVVECGVWQGGSMMIAALTLLALGDTQRHLWLFDTFEGLPRPDAQKDVDMWGNSQFNEWLRHRRDDESSTMAYASLDEVQHNMGSTGYPSDKIKYVKGMVQNTLPSHQPERIALLRLDTDWYESTVSELHHLYPRLSATGVLIVDDYGHLRGQRQAIDEYFAGTGEFPLLNRIDYSGRLAIKLTRNGDGAALR